MVLYLELQAAVGTWTFPFTQLREWMTWPGGAPLGCVIFKQWQQTPEKLLAYCHWGGSPHCYMFQKVNFFFKSHLQLKKKKKNRSSYVIVCCWNKVEGVNKLLYCCLGFFTSLSLFNSGFNILNHPCKMCLHNPFTSHSTAHLCSGYHQTLKENEIVSPLSCRFFLLSGMVTLETLGIYMFPGCVCQNSAIWLFVVDFLKSLHCSNSHWGN